MMDWSWLAVIGAGIVGAVIGFFYGRALMVYQIEKEGYSIRHDFGKKLGAGRFSVRRRA